MPKDRPIEQRREFPDATPVTRAVNIRAKIGTLEEMRRAYHLIRLEAEAHQIETPEDADDFDVGDDFDPASPFEHDFDNVPVAQLGEPAAVAPGAPVAPAPGPTVGNGAPGGVPPVPAPSPSPSSS